jgi:hypothetical protein
MPVRESPDVRLRILGQEYRRFESASTVFTAYHEPNTFDVTLPLDTELQRAIIQAKAPRCDIFVDGAPWFYGLIDEAEGDVDDESGERILRLNGQDLMKPFFRTPILETIKSRTASEWISERARAHGLKAQVTTSAQPIGALVESNHSTLSNHQKEADLLQDLNAYHGYVARVDLDTFIWGPPPPPSLHLRWHLGQHFNHFNWRKTFDAEQIRVEVIGWSPRKKKGLKQAKATAGEGQYVIRLIRPGITDRAAEKLARSVLEQAERAALLVSISDLPGDTRLRGLAWDFTLFDVGAGPSQKFFPTNVTHKFTPDTHVMDVEGFNRVEAQA